MDEIVSTIRKAPMANLVGHSLGRYHILEQLGEGGMAYNDGFVEFNGLIRSIPRIRVLDDAPPYINSPA